MNGDSLTRDSRGAVHSTAIVAACLAAWSIGAYVFYLLAGRLLGPEEYGLVAALQAVIVVLALPAVSLQWSIARSIASSDGTSQADTAATYRRAVVLGSIASVILAAIATAATVALGSANPGIPVGPLVATYWSATPLVPLVLGMGALQGRHRYWGFAWSYGSTGVLRAPFLLLLLAIPLIGGVEATSLATGIPYLIGAAMALWLTRELLTRRARPSREAWRSFARVLGVSAIGLGGIAVLTNVDVVAAKIGIGGDEAGYFGAAAIIAKALMLVPQALTVVLLPRVAEREARGSTTGPLLAAGVAVMFAAGIVAMLLAIPLEGWITTITFGSEFAPAADLLVPFLGATTLLGALLILVNHHIARSDHRFAWVVGGLAVVQVVLLAFFSTSAGAIIAVDATVAAIGLIVHEMLYFRTDESMLRGVARQARAVLNRTRTTGAPR